IAFITVVFPVPGPPVITARPARRTASTARRCPSESRASSWTARPSARGGGSPPPAAVSARIRAASCLPARARSGRQTRTPACRARHGRARGGSGCSGGGGGGLDDDGALLDERRERRGETRLVAADHLGGALEQQLRRGVAVALVGERLQRVVERGLGPQRGA